MPFKTVLFASALALVSLPVLAGESGIVIQDAYARSGAKSGAAFFVIENRGDRDDRLVSASADVAPRVELHTHLEDDNGVMRMREIEGGIVVGKGETHALARGGDHVMFMGLEQPFIQGETVTVTLSFEHAGDVVVEIPVDQDRKVSH